MDGELSDILRGLKNIPEDKWDRYILRQDLFYRYYTEEMRHAIITGAKEAGKKKTHEIMGEGHVSPGTLACESELDVRVSGEEEFLMPDSVNFAEYHDGRIKISKKLLDALDKNKEVIHDVLGEFSPYDVLLCHELYHYYEEERPETENAGLSLKVKMMPFVTKRVSPESAGEIAAYEFAKQMTGIRFHPYILGLAGLYEYDSALACDIMNEINIQ